jgi:hypothetical protein
MRKTKSSISKSGSYEELSSFWESHDLEEYWEKTLPAEFNVELIGTASYVPVEPGLYKQARALARRKGVSAVSLFNEWARKGVADSSGAEAVPKVKEPPPKRAYAKRKNDLI